MNFFQRIKGIAALAVVFLLVLATNMMDKKYFATVEQTLETVYKDRLVVKDYIYKISRRLAEKRALLYEADPYFYGRSVRHNDDIRQLFDLYRETKLTDEEQRLLSQLRDELQELFRTEGELKAGFRSRDHRPAT